MAKSYHVSAVWDPEAEVFYAETDIPGLHVEATTLSEFVEIVQELVPQLLDANVSPGQTNHDVQRALPTLKSAAMELCYA